MTLYWSDIIFDHYNARWFETSVSYSYLRTLLTLFLLSRINSFSPSFFFMRLSELHLPPCGDKLLAIKIKTLSCSKLQFKIFLFIHYIYPNRLASLSWLLWSFLENKKCLRHWRAWCPMHISEPRGAEQKAGHIRHCIHTDTRTHFFNLPL